MSDRVTWSDGAYAGFWLRAAARLIDWLIVGAVTTVIGMVFGLVLSVAVLAGSGIETGEPFAFGEASSVLAFFLWMAVVFLPEFLYETIMTSRFGWTLGKRAVGVEVRGSDGGLLSYGRAVGRYVGRFVSGIALGLGYLWAAWDPRKQTWHDKFVDSFVVMSARLSPAGAVASTARPWGGQAGWGIPGTARPAGGAPPDTTEPAASGGLATTAWSGGDFGPLVDPDRGSDPMPAPGPDPEPTPMPGPDPESTPVPGPDPEPTPAPEPDPEPTPAPEPRGAADLDWTRELDWEAQPAPAPTSEPEPPAAPAPEPPATAEPETAPLTTTSDPNRVAVGRAGLSSESAAWLEQVANQVDARLDRVAPRWRDQPHAEAARACAYGLLLGHLASIYPHMTTDLSRVAEAHPSFSTLAAGSRLSTLQQIVGDPRRAAAWVGPLVGVEDPDQVSRLLD